MEPSDEFVLIDSYNGTVYTMEQSRKSMEIEMYRLIHGKFFHFFSFN